MDSRVVNLVDRAFITIESLGAQDEYVGALISLLTHYRQTHQGYAAPVSGDLSYEVFGELIDGVDLSEGDVDAIVARAEEAYRRMTRVSLDLALVVAAPEVESAIPLIVEMLESCSESVPRSSARDERGVTRLLSSLDAVSPAESMRWIELFAQYSGEIGNDARYLASLR